MALGFIVTNITDSKVLPDRSLSRSSTPLVKVASFGDGYQQRVADGLNSLGEDFSVTFANRGKSNADDIIAFFAANKGVTSFNFTYPDTNSTTTATAVTDEVTSSTATVDGASSTNTLILDPGADLENILVGATVTGTGVNALVVSITGTTLVLNSTVNAADGVTLTFNTSKNVTLEAANLDISSGATVTGTGISGTVTVSSIIGTALVLSSVQTIAADVTLTFTNPDEREIKVVCSTWSQSYAHLSNSTISSTFKRVYEA